MSGGESAPAAACLDTRGLLCPAPLIELARAVRDLPPGAVLEILADDPGIEPDLPAWCLAHGHEFLSLREEAGGLFRGRVRKSGPSRPHS